MTAAKQIRNLRSLQLALRPELSLVDGPAGDLCLTSPIGALTFRRLTPGLRNVFAALVAGGSTLDQLSTSVVSGEGQEALTKMFHHLEQLSRRGLLRHTVAVGSEPIATITGIGLRYRFELRAIDTSRPYLLSRFAYCRREGANTVLETPLGQAQIILHDWRATALISMLAEPRAVSELLDRWPGMDDDVIAGCFQLLLNARALAAASEDTDMEEDNPALAQWSFHDLLFHSRSRYGRHNNPYGATFRHINSIQPLPAVKPVGVGPRIELHRPNLPQLDLSDPSLVHVMETRRSIYEYGQQPITIEQLGDFLFRVARVKSQGEMRVKSFYGPGETVMETTSRPYPAGGKCYELELYLVVDQCQGLAPGMYHYEPLDHCLTHVSDRNEHVEAFFRYAAVAAPNGHPQVLIELAARFQRVSWKYDGIAYATTLKHVGVLYQTMYLVATAMGLGPCALGSGDSDLFAAATGHDYYTETSVGEFMLGSLPSQTADSRAEDSGSAEDSGCEAASPE
ncbi:MAG TPA: SagB family peptide dehydrogenase [Blastocatellia bacterium]|nr:SagB family peptide dehydrogenase [Blastocatellia bacterium]